MCIRDRKEEGLRDQIEKAKWTAVNQHVDYDQYRQLCLGANLKPVAPGSIESIMDNKMKNNTRRNRRRGNKTDSREIKEAVPEPTSAPADRDEFDRQWRAACKDAGSRFRYLCLIPSSLFSKLLQVEIGFDLLGEIVAAVDECWINDEEIEVVFEIMKALPSAFRFELAINFLGSDEKGAIERVFERLSKVESIADDELSGLRHKFH
eukprot:TRINITY_DN1824_c0_g1_i2.p1 TRINITY_DN1824_c0_g1~~TRINITY_DN1824_c0_g1_i2.p1  ORF type:complete len:207 (-),score=50.66 TRINITY_DN1824_c0_g1_i2:439-1059(-)